MLTNWMFALFLCSLFSVGTCKKVREFERVDNVSLDFYKSSRITKPNISNHLRCSMACDQMGHWKCNAFQFNWKTMICSLYMVFDKKESLPQGLLTEVFLANPLVSNEFPSKFIVLHKKDSSPQTKLSVAVRSFDWQMCKQLPDFPRSQDMHNAGTPINIGGSMTMLDSTNEPRVALKLAIKKKKGKKWFWEKINRLPDDNRNWHNAHHIELLGRHYFYTYKEKMPNAKSRRQFIIYEYDPFEDTWTPWQELTLSGSTKAQTLMGWFAWKGQDSVVLLVFRNGRISAVDFAKQDFHSFEDSFKDLMTKRDQSMNVIYTFETLRNADKVGLVAGDRETEFNYFLDYSNAIIGWTPLNGIKDPSLENLGMVTQTGSGNAIRYARRRGDPKMQYRLAFWSKSQGRFVETEFEAKLPTAPRDFFNWDFRIFYDVALDGIACG